MIKLKIDNIPIEVDNGQTVLQAARKAGKDVPTLCYYEKLGHFTSCMVCMVKDEISGKLLPSCSVKAENGMQILTTDDEIHESRKTALELLLSEHIGDCEAPCQLTCPAHMDIPQMNRLLAAGKFSDALDVVRKDIALPSVLGRICQAPCEKACRRKDVDEAVSICILKRYAGDYGNEAKPQIVETGKKVAIIGSGPAGLAAAYYIRLRGHQVTVFEKNKLPGGTLLTETTDAELPREVLHREIKIIEECGVSFHLNHLVDKQEYERICGVYDAVVIASGSKQFPVSSLQFPVDSNGNKPGGREWSSVIGRQSSGDESGIEAGNRIFVTGSALRSNKMAIRALGQGKEIAFSVDQYIKGEKVVGEIRKFNSRFGRMLAEEYSEYLKETVDESGEQLPPARVEPAAGISGGYSEQEVMTEAARCMHCDCREIDNCGLRDLSDEYQAVQKRYMTSERGLVTKQMQHDVLVFEDSKCIKCSICVRIAREAKEDLGLSFIGRGFDVKIGVPFGESMSDALKKTAAEVADACPTGALSKKK